MPQGRNLKLSNFPQQSGNWKYLDLNQVLSFSKGSSVYLFFHSLHKHLLFKSYSWLAFTLSLHSGSALQVEKAFIVLTPQILSHDLDQLTKELQRYVKSVTALYKYPRKVSEGGCSVPLLSSAAPSLLGWLGDA